MKVYNLSFLLLICFFVSCSSNNVTQDDSLKKYFDSANVRGCFGIFDNISGQFTIYNISEFKDSARVPGNSFDLVNALIGIQTGKIGAKELPAYWDSNKSFTNSWDSAAKYLANPTSLPDQQVHHDWTEELATRIGKATMQHWLDSLGYGQRYGKFKIGDNLNRFWTDNSLRITADEQMGLVKNLYFDKLPFYKTTQGALKPLLIKEDNSNYKLAYKSAIATDPGKQAIGWTFGWVEENRHPYFFVLETVGGSGDQIPLLKKVLTHMGFFQGKK